MSAFKDRAVVEEMRLMGNTLFKAGQYRRAEQVYKNGLALMDLSLDNVCITGPPFCGHINSTRVAMALSARDNLSAATLLVNLAQALLSGSIQPEAAREAFYIICWAESHLIAVRFMNITKPTHLSAFEIERLDQQHRTLREKAFMRKGMALERCADPAGALTAYLRCKGNSAMERRENMMDVLQSYHSKKDGSMLLVDKFMHNNFLLPHAHWKYFAILSPREIPFADTGMGGHDLGRMKSAYSCGIVQEVHTLVVTRFKCRESSCASADTDLHFFCRLSPDGAMSSWFPLGADTGSMCDTGAVLNEKLYCMSLCNDPYVKVWNMKSTGGHDKPLRISILETPIGHDFHLRRLFADIVGCCGDLYMFGGLAFGPDREIPEADGDLLRFTHNHDQFMECSVYFQPDVRQEVSYPQPRFGHATFVHGHYIYIFGGTEGREPINDILPGSVIASYMDDLWCFDVRTKEWRNLEPLGVRPSPRAFMGVGSNGKCTVIMGGESLREGFHSAYNLADMWEFDPEACTWTPIVDDPNQNWCLASRKCPGMAMVSNGDVFVFGGHSDRRNRNGAVDCVHVSVNRWNADKMDSYRRRMRPPKGAWRDAATEEMCKLRAQKQYWFGTSEKERLLMSAPAGSVVVLTPRPVELAPCAVTPADAANPSFRHLHPFHYEFYPDPIGLLRPIEGNAMYLFGRRGVPFHAAPRWLTPPSEVTTKLLASPGDSLVLPEEHGSCWALWHSVKHFSTVKAAALFFRMHQPKISWEQPSNGWCRVKGLPLYKDTQRLLEWDVRELSVFYTTEEKRSQTKSLLIAQYYISVVFGRVFVCMLADVPVVPDLLSRIAELHVEVAESLIRMQHELLTQPSVNLRPACQYCGKSDPPTTTVEQYPSQITIKVCKGCRLVRYCGQMCQQADWHKHRTVCKKIAAGQLQVDDLWTADNPD